MKTQIETIITKLHGVSGQLAAINSAAEDSEYADALFGTRDYLETIIEELATIAEGE